MCDLSDVIGAMRMAVPLAACGESIGTNCKVYYRGQSMASNVFLMEFTVSLRMETFVDCDSKSGEFKRCYLGKDIPIIVPNTDIRRETRLLDIGTRIPGMGGTLG